MLTAAEMHLKSLRMRLKLTQTEAHKFWTDWTKEQKNDALSAAIADVEVALAAALKEVRHVAAEREAGDAD